MIKMRLITIRDGYGKAIAILKALPKKVESVKDIQNVAGLGSGSVSRIKEILTTGRISKMELFTVSYYGIESNKCIKRMRRRLRCYNFLMMYMELDEQLHCSYTTKAFALSMI
jgi:DNA polymerase/3'-5' exonuclease PolX